MKIVVLFFSYLLLKMCQALDCEEEETEDFCVLKGYKRAKLPPYPPLNISMSLSISVRYNFSLRTYRQTNISFLFPNSTKDGLARSPDLVSPPKNRIFGLDRLRVFKRKLKKQSKSEKF